MSKESYLWYISWFSKASTVSVHDDGTIVEHIFKDLTYLQPFYVIW